MPYESVYDYLEQVDSETYLSEIWYKFFEKYLMEQDLEGWGDMFEEYDENYDLSDVMGDEEVWNLKKAIDWQKHGQFGKIKGWEDYTSM